MRREPQGGRGCQFCSPCVLARLLLQSSTTATAQSVEAFYGANRSQGGMWYASSVNNKIGYFDFNDDPDMATK